MPMKNIKPFKPNERQAKQWLKEAAQGNRRLLFSPHAELRMRQRKIGRRQVLETLGRGSISEPLHQDIQGTGAAISVGNMRGCALRWVRYSSCKKMANG